MVSQSLAQILQLGKLILSQRFGRKEVESARVRIFQDRVQNRKVVAERFPGSGRSHNHDIFAAVYPLGRFRLMRIELRDTLLPR